MLHSQKNAVFLSTALNSPVGNSVFPRKGLDCFKVLSSNRVAYMDPSAVATKHLHNTFENGRILYSCPFDEKPMILRPLYGKDIQFLVVIKWSELVLAFLNMPQALGRLSWQILSQVQSSMGLCSEI